MCLPREKGIQINVVVINHVDGGSVLKTHIFRLSNIYKQFNPFKPEFIIVIFIHYKPRIADLKSVKK